MSVTPAEVPVSRSRWRNPGGLGWTALVTTAFIVAPILVVVGYVFQPGQSSLEHLFGTVLPEYVWSTLLLMLGVAAGVISIGVTSAWLVTVYRFPGQRVLEWALVLPLAMPAYVMAYAYTDWLQFAGPVQTTLRELTGWGPRDYWFPEIRSLWGAAAMFSFALYPYVYLLARTAFLEQSRSAIETARLAGYGAWGSFWRAGLPLARPAIAAGSALALMETLADFGTVAYFAVQTFTTGIFRAWLSFGDIVGAAQLATCMLGFVFVLLWMERHHRGAARYQSNAARRPLPPRLLRGRQAVFASLACSAPVIFGFFLPAGVLINLTIRERESIWIERVLTLVTNSFTLAGVTAVAAVLLAVLVAYATRLSKHPAVNAANRLASLGYAIPGAVIAIGILIPLARFDNILADVVENAFGVDIGLLFTGTILALVYAYLVRYLAVALQTVDAGLAKITPSMDDAARSLGLGPARTLRRVHAPMLWGSMLTAGLLVFVDVMKELPATFALRPFNFDTLAIEAFNLTKDERLAEAALPSLLIVAVGLLPLIIISRRMTRDRARH